MREYALTFAKKQGYSVDLINQYAEQSHRKARLAMESGWFTEEIAPCGEVTADQLVSEERLAAMRAECAEDPAGSRFCSNCGIDLTGGQNSPGPAPPPVYPPGPYHQPYQPYGSPCGYPVSLIKDPGIAAILALLAGFVGLMGMGHIYIGRFARGLIILVAGLVLWSLVIGTSFIAIIALGGALWLLSLVFIFAALGLLVWQAYDAYNLAKQYNTVLRQTGRAPW
jgi:hypothetical protein